MKRVRGVDFMNTALRLRFRISTTTRILLSEIFRDFPHFLQQDAGIVPQIRPRPLFSHIFYFPVFLFAALPAIGSAGL